MFKPFPSYPGGKDADGVYHFIINHIPRFQRLIIPFLGGGAIYRRLEDIPQALLSDRDDQVVRAWRPYPGLQLAPLFPAEPTGHHLACLDFREALAHAREQGYLLDPDTFLYLDPPYPLNARRRQRPLYRYELSGEDHRELLRLITAPDLRCHIMLSSYPNALYDLNLARWHRLTFTGKTRQGSVTEAIYLNYDPQGLPLHTYRYAGLDHREREALTRKRRRWLRKLHRMPARHRQAILADIQQTYFPSPDPCSLLPVP